MSMRDVERAILVELKEVSGRKKLRLKDIQEWSTGEEQVRKNAREDEEVHHLPGIGVWAAIKKEA